MVYMLLIYAPESDWAHLTPAEMEPTMQAHRALESELRAAGKYRGCGGLAVTDAATTLRYRDGKPVIIDGPYAETKEQFGGFYLIEAADLDEALAYARRIPGVDSRAVEVRPVAHFAPA